MRVLGQLLFACFVAWTVGSCGGESTSEAVDSPTLDPLADCSEVSDTSGDNPPGFDIALRCPVPNASARALVTDISIEFTHPVIENTLSSETIFLTGNGSPVATQLIHEAGSSKVTLTPDSPLQPQTQYTVTVTDELMASDGSLFPGESWLFETAGNVGATTQAVIDECMSDIDLDMLAQINDARSSARNCGEQPAAAVGTLAWHCTIDAAAQKHSDDMADNNFFSHTGSDGSSAGDRLTNVGYPWQRAGENIAAGQTSVTQVMEGLLNSPGHCLNIMNGNYTEVGAALTENSAADYHLYWTQNFAHPR